MNVVEFLDRLSAKEITLWVEGAQLRYRAPEESLTPELFEELKQHKAEILAWLKEREQDEAPLSHGQQALWFLHRLAPHSAAYNMMYTARLPSALEIPLLQQAAQALVDRHPILRTTITMRNGKPVQLCHKTEAVDFTVTDGSTWDQEQVNGWIDREADRPFHLARGPLLRLQLLTQDTPSAAKGSILLLVIHHIAADFISLQILLKELEELYLVAKGSHSSLPPLTRTYTEHVRWEADMLAAEGEKLAAYWTQKLAGAPTLLNLPTDRPRPPVPSYRGAEVTVEFDQSLIQQLRQVAQTNGATLYMTMLAAFQLLLHRYTGAESLLIGSPTAGRELAGTEQVIGYFVNPVVLRADFAQVHSFQQLLQQVRRTVLDALIHQRYPFPLLVERLQPNRDPSYSPLFQVAFAWEQAPDRGRRQARSPRLIEPLSAGQRGADFDLSLMIFDEGESCWGTFRYSSDLFDHNTIVRMVGHLNSVLAGIVADPAQDIGALPLLTAAERKQLFAWNDTAVDYPTTQCSHQLFEAQVERTPDAIAVVCGEQQLTYREVNRRANQVAHYLMAKGIGPNAIVATCLPRSSELIVSQLGILKAGGVYLPLDPLLPVERLQFMCDDANIKGLITGQECIPHLQAPTYLKLTDAWFSRQPQVSNLITQVCTEHLAYCIYTSGTTGQPKGVLISHGGLLNLLFWHQATFQITAGDRATHLANPAFDAAVWEVWPYLTAGATLYVVDDERLLVPEEWQRWILANTITVTFLPTPLAEMVIALAWPSAAPLRLLLTGGDMLRHFPQPGLPFMVINNYGPTENSVVTTSGVVQAMQVAKRPFPTIGRPIANTQIYILDTRQQLVPIGVPGELHIGGAGLASAYLNRPQLTAERFIPNPFGPGKLYKTGDLCRYLPDENGDAAIGNIEFLGRIDNQVKLRGFRIELGEIEAALCQCPSVREAAVLLREDIVGDKQLVAYVTWHDALLAAGGLSQAESTLSAQLKLVLPEYMVPRTIVTVATMPLTPNGKLDRQALPIPARKQQGHISAPRTPAEVMLAQIWQEALGVPVGIHDNFFALGGHSLLAIQVVSRLRQTAQVELPLHSLFATPTIAALAAQLTVTADGLPPIEPLDPQRRRAPLPLSFAQQQIWLVAQFERTTKAYHIPIAYRLAGQLDVAALRASLQVLCERHEVLRTTFPLVQGQAYQQISTVNTELQFIDLSGLPKESAAAAVGNFLQKEAGRAFDLAHGPLWRITLLRLAEDSHLLALTLHHIIADGWSIAVLMRELSTLYNQKRHHPQSRRDDTGSGRDDTAGLPALSIQYADFTLWQRAWLQGDLLAAQLDYWKQQLAGAPPLLLLPTDHPRPAQQRYRGDHLFFTLPQGLGEEINQLSHQQNTTLFMTLQAAFAVLLWRYTAQEDICIGTPIANRQVAEVEHLIGFFANTLVLRNDLSGNPTFGDFLARVRQVALDAYQHQALPFALLVEQLQPARSLSHNPLFQVMFALENSRQTMPFFTDLTTSPVEVAYPHAKFDLSLSVQEGEEEGHFTTWWEYNTDLFERTTIERMARHFQTLLEGIVANPLTTIAHLPLLTESEEAQLLVEWNDTQSGHRSGTCLHQLFEEQVERTPDLVALVCGDQQITYRELNAKANQLAHYLMAQGIGGATDPASSLCLTPPPNTLVGICMERSLEMVVALLGILKAGAAYVPLDPNYPQERLAFMLADAQISTIITQESSRAHVPATAHIICLDSMWAPITDQDITNPECPISPAQLAYVIYTSGSVGEPKGVLIEHGAVVNFVHAATAAYNITAADRVLQFASISFDTAVEEIYPCLCRGGTLVLRTAQMLASIPAFMQASQDLGLTIWDLPTAYWHLLTSELIANKLPLPDALRLVIIGGERALPGRVAQWQQMIKHSSNKPDLINTYGPTEATVVATTWLLPAPTDRPAELEIPIGRPLNNVQAYILDPYNQPVPIGVAGELHIGGAGVARGYLNRPQLTKERFIPNPFDHPQESGRLYKTGDLVRWLPSGDLEFLGRTDNQVKVRGFRIELGEIEVCLSQQANVREVAVAVQEDETGQRLVAYLVGNDAFDVTRLRSKLTKQLPDYMIPSAFLQLEAMPLTPNGKLDRNALPAPDYAATQAEFVAPRTPLEEQLAAIWREILHVDKVGVYDNFFALGGHSLLATQMISRIQMKLNREVPLKLLFEVPEIAPFAQQLQPETNPALTTEGHVLQNSPIRPLKRDGTNRFPLSFAQQRLWFLDQLEPLSAFYNIPLLIRLEGKLDLVALEQSFTYLIRRHESMRTTFSMATAEEEGEPVQVVHTPAAFTLSVIPVANESAARRQAQVEAIRPFELTTGPLLRVQLFELAETHHLLLFTIHHIISDGWSMDLLVKELTHAYTAYARATTPTLPNLPIQYADFAAWQRNKLSDQHLAMQLSYWREQLAGIPALLELPTDRPRPAIQSYHGAHHCFTLKSELVQRLQALSLASGTTLFMTMLAAFKVLLMRYSSQEDIVVGSPIANRNHLATESLMGFFVNTLVLRSDLSGNPTFQDLLAQIKHTTLAAFSHQDVPFEKVVEEVHLPRNLSHSPLFQVMFDLRQQSMSTFTLPDLTIEHVDLAYPIAKFDLTLAIEVRQADAGLGDRELINGILEYNTDLFDQTTIERMSGHFQALLEQIVTNPHQPIGAYALLTDQERHQIVVDWNATTSAYPKDKPIHRLFEEQVERTPEAIAVVFAHEQLTYRRLNERANRLAHYLIEQGVGADMLVGICMERSLAMVEGLLGILKAGGAYVPLDPSYPQERLRFMMEDTNASVIVTQKCFAHLFTKSQYTVVVLDRRGDEITCRPATNIKREIASTAPAYLIYTSGSTGLPKGVPIPHRAISRLLINTNYITILPSDRIAQASNVSFDAATFEIWGALLHGATLVVAPREITLVPQDFAAFLQRQEISILFITTALFNLIARTIPQAFATLRYLLFGGEAVDPTAVRAVLQQGKPANLLHVYGPTESTTYSTWYPVQNVAATAPTVPIGTAVANTQLYVLDGHLQPVPIGIPGELYIGGDGLATGYHNRPERTAEQFIPNRFGAGRLYRTGDLVRWLADGNLEFIGRVDNQVKIRGFRIELGEIEAVLGQHPAVQEAVVIVHDGEHTLTGEKKQLVAIVVLSDKMATQSSDGTQSSTPPSIRATLRTHLQQILPDYMIPSTFVYLDALPLTANGKIDRKALVQKPLTLDRGVGDGEFVPPKTAAEKILAQIWAEVLGLERVGRYDNFFEVGGHSLLAIQLVAKIASAFAVNISVKFLFLQPTVAKQAEALQHDQPPLALPPSSRAIQQQEPILQNGCESTGYAVPSARHKEFQDREFQDNQVEMGNQQLEVDSSYFQIENRSLLSLFEQGELEPVASVALGYLPDTIAGLFNGDAAQMRKAVGGGPHLSEVMTTAWGRIGIITLPYVSGQLYTEQEALVRDIGDALQIAQQIGAKAVSLTGLIPSATEYGKAVLQAVAPGANSPTISTGHGTTSAAVVMNIRRIIQESGRDLAGEQVGFIGLGSIGLTTLRLLLHCLPHPQKLTLCDIYTKHLLLEQLQQELVEHFQFQGEIELIPVKGFLPSELYSATLIVGATNVPDVLDMTQVRPGTLLVDDSGPHCFSTPLAIERFQRQPDILFTEGGVLQSPKHITSTIHFPSQVADRLNLVEFINTAWLDPANITGCVLSSLLSASFGLPPTTGMIGVENALQHYHLLAELGFQGSQLHCEGYVLPQEAIAEFRARFA